MRRENEVVIAMNPEEKQFYLNLGKQIAALRNERGLTQAQLAEVLGISQQQMLSFEKGRRRIAVVTLSILSDTLGVDARELLGAGTGRSTNKRGPTPKLQRQLERLNQLPRSKQRFVSDMIDTVLQQAGR
jgi:transcriptional regulator with XRE-family HTH domain